MYIPANINAMGIPPRLAQFIMEQTANKGMPTANGNTFGTLPGAKQGLSVEQVQQIIATSKRMKGFTTVLAAGANTPVEIDISGTANWLLGFVLFPKTNFNNAAATPLSVSLMINDEQGITNAPFNLLNKQFIQGEYFSYPRPLGGQDSVTLTYNNTGFLQQTVEALFYYL